jgi:hypothetical protein
VLKHFFTKATPDYKLPEFIHVFLPLLIKLSPLRTSPHFACENELLLFFMLVNMIRANDKQEKKGKEEKKKDGKF